MTSTETNPEFRPTLNHVAVSMDPTVLDEKGRAEILDFYGEVFGWTEGDNSMEQGNPLILYTGPFGQFVYLLPGEPYMVTHHLDHFGFQVETMEQLQDIVDRAKKRQATDDRVKIIDVKSRLTNGPDSRFTFTSAYIGFVIPLMVELQHLEKREPGAPPLPE
jgi:hypothetical protein